VQKLLDFNVGTRNWIRKG